MARFFMRWCAALLLVPLGLAWVPASAGASSWEKDFAKKNDALENPIICSGIDTYFGGTYWEPHYTACIHLKGDILMATDARKDGDAAVMKWKFFAINDEGNGYAAPAARKGVCIYTGGSEPGFRTGLCNKNLPEEGLIQFWAGKRTVSGSTKLSDMKFGSPVCIGVDGNAGINDADCLLAP